MQQQSPDKKENVANKVRINEGRDKLIRQQEKEEIATAEEATKLQKLPPSPPSPHSASSSPSREFSFTISLQRSSTTPFDNSKGGPPSFAIDLTPADDIFFHGHLIPLQLLSHLPVSPRSSTNSIDSFTLPIRELIEDPKPDKFDDGKCRSTSCGNNVKEDNLYNTSKSNTRSFETKGRHTKLKSFSILGLIKWQKQCEVTDKEDKEKRKRKLKSHVSHVVKKYLRMVQPLLFFKGRREDITVDRQPNSFSAKSLSMRNNKKVLRGRREHSAPASIRTSPTNSGLLVATTALPSSSESTMEELQAAIQAAITHCKNSLAGGRNSKDDQ